MRVATFVIACAGLGLAVSEPEAIHAQAPPEAAESPAPRTPALVENYTGAVIQAVPDSFGFHPFYKKYVDAHGIPVLSSEKLPDDALLVARDIVNTMLAARPDFRAAMRERNWRVAIMAETEITADIPEHADRKRPGAPRDEPVTQEDIDFWARRARGLGGKHILVHEFAHAIMGGGVRNADPDLHQAIRAAYDQAMAQGKYRYDDGREHYATTNANEYWAEGVQWWFWSNYGECFTGGVRVQTPEDLEAYDPILYYLIGHVFDTHRIPMDVFHGRNLRRNSENESEPVMTCDSPEP